jgi:DNA-binding transcriptional MerR regulator
MCASQEPKYLRTLDVARAVGVHPNTVRLYEQWGFLPPIPRSPGGYRRFTQFYLLRTPPVADLTATDPPIEVVIDQVYQDGNI